MTGPTPSTRTAFHRLLTDGIEVSFRDRDGRERHELVWAVDWRDPGSNDWLVANQFIVKEGDHHRRLDIAVFLNGLPIGVFELKNAADEEATVAGAFQQLQNYKEELPMLFGFNEVLVISDGTQARFGSLTANHERFMPWRTIGGERDAPAGMPEVQVLIEGMFERGRLLRYLRDFISFEVTRGSTVKILAGYQYRVSLHGERMRMVPLGYLANLSINWYRGWDSNPHALRPRILSPLRMPVPPPRRVVWPLACSGAGSVRACVGTMPGALMSPRSSVRPSGSQLHAGARSVPRAATRRVAVLHDEDHGRAAVAASGLESPQSAERARDMTHRGQIPTNPAPPHRRRRYGVPPSRAACRGAAIRRMRS